MNLMKVVKTMSDKKKELEKLIGNLNANFGEGTVMFGAEAVEALKTERVTTASMEVDIALHGGFFRGGIVEIFGPESSGKTEFLLETIGKHQKEDPNFYAFWIETEGSLDLEDAKNKHGVDPDRLAVHYLDSSKGAEESLEFVRGLISSGLFDMGCVNSVAGLVTKAEADKKVGEAVMADQARMMSKFFRMETGNIFKNRLILAFVNQERDSMAMYSGPTTGN